VPSHGAGAASTKEAWVVHREPAWRSTILDDGGAQHDFTFTFRKPPSLAVKAAYRATFRKFRLGVDCHGLPAEDAPAAPAPAAAPTSALATSPVQREASGLHEASTGPLCAICLEPLACDAVAASTEMHAMQCGHSFHTKCLHEWVTASRANNRHRTISCPLCRRPGRPTLAQSLQDKLSRRQRPPLVNVTRAHAPARWGSPWVGAGTATRTQRLERLKFEVLPALLAVV
jgi:hypothetical protein